MARTKSTPAIARPEGVVTRPAELWADEMVLPKTYKKGSGVTVVDRSGVEFVLYPVDIRDAWRLPNVKKWYAVGDAKGAELTQVNRLKVGAGVSAPQSKKTLAKMRPKGFVRYDIKKETAPSPMPTTKPNVVPAPNGASRPVRQTRKRIRMIVELSLQFLQNPSKVTTLNIYLWSKTEMEIEKMGEALGVSPTEAMQVLLLLEDRGACDGFLVVYHRDEKNELLRRPIIDGFPEVPMQTAHGLVTHRDELRFGFVFVMKEGVVAQVVYKAEESE
jgi:hypothetical protein